MKKHYYLVIDTETANTINDALVYDCGFMVIDRKGNIYKEASYIIYDIFVGEKELMKSAYYANKIESYEKDLKAGIRKMITFTNLKFIIQDTINQYHIKKVFAYNANFDRNALNTTQRYLTKSKYRYFFPYNTEIGCIWATACQTICKQKKYFKFIKENDYFIRHKVKTSAEIVYQFITGQKDFIESHTALEDVAIEKDILLKCLRQHKKINTTPQIYPAHKINAEYKKWIGN